MHDTILRVNEPIALRDSLDHHATKYLAGDAGGHRDPGDYFAVLIIESEGDVHDLSVSSR
jgi:hypothetical protein